MAYTSRHYEVALEGQTKTATPSTTSQTITPDSGKKLTSVTVEAMPSGSAGTPVATKGTVSNNSITVTPSVTSSTGYITGSTVSGTAVTVSASELVSGTLTLTENVSSQDCTNYANVTVNVPTPTVSLTDFTVEGDWTNEQTKGSAVDITGLTPTGSFSASGTVTSPAGSISVSGSNSGSVSGYTYSPQTWAASGDIQTCTFSYTYGGVTKTATKHYIWIPPLRVGGRIFYINTSATGATYRFYDSSYNEITDISVSGLANAYYYTKSGTSSADKFYVADSTNGMRKYNGTYCMWATATEDLSSYSSSIEVLSSASSSVIGKGKTNTAWILANRNNSTYYPAHNSVSGKITCWDFAKTCNDNSVNECTDWFVPNIAEVTQLRNSGIWGSSLAEWVATTKYGSNSYSNLWSSSAYSNANLAWFWNADTSYSLDYARDLYRTSQGNYYFVAVVRAF